MDRLTVTFDPVLSHMITMRASQGKESNVSDFVARLMRIALNHTQPRHPVDVNISPRLMSFVGIAKLDNEQDWKERKEGALAEKYGM